MPEIIYVLTNEKMPGLVKIGRTTNSVEARVAELSSSTSVPVPFECHFAAEVENSSALEKKLHQLFSENRVNPRREFFELDPERVVLAISIGPYKELSVGDPAELLQEDREALERVRSRRPNLRLDAIGIYTGDVLTFSRNEDVTATVVAGNRVLFNGVVKSLSAAAYEALHSMGYTTPATCGSEYWMFDGELLDERRRRMEAEEHNQCDAESGVSQPSDLGNQS